MSSQVLVYNPTPHPRRQIVRFGCPKDQLSPGALILEELPTSYLATARVMVPPWHNGPVDVDASDQEFDEDFSFYKTMQFADEAAISDPIWSETIMAQNEALKSVVLCATNQDPGEHVYLFVTQGAGEKWCHVQYLKVAAFLGRPEAMVFHLPQVTGGTLHARINPTMTHTIRDQSALSWFGSVVALDGDLDSLEDLSTAKGEREYELTATGDWPEWGPWSTQPTGRHKDRSVRLGLDDHRGILLNPRPGDTGEQYGLGNVKHLDCLRAGQLQNLAHDRAAVIQECRRTMWLLETDGRIPDPKDHPDFVSWSETMHWNRGVCPDRFGRIYQHSGWYDGWLGMDEEHYSATALAEDYMLLGTPMSKFMLQMKLFHWLKQRPSTDGRAMGRHSFAAVDFYRALGDRRIIERLEEVWLPQFKGSWVWNNGHWISPLDITAEGPHITRRILDDPHTGIKGWGWYVWEDGIAVQALDVIWPLLQSAELKLATYLLARSVIQHGFNSDGRIYKAVAWKGPDHPTAGQQYASSQETNYTEWAAPALIIGARLAHEFGDQKTQDLAARYFTPLLTGGYPNLDSYLGPLGR